VLNDREGADNVVDVTIDVFEGDRFRLGRLEFSGNTKTNDKVLRREFRLAEGSYMNMGLFRSSVFKVNALGYFKLEEDPVEFDFNDVDKTVDVVVKGNEVGRNDIQFGAGYSELDGLFGQVRFSTRNFRGRGESLSMSVQAGGRADYYTLAYSDPYFLDRRIILGGSIFKTSIDVADYYRETTGATLTVGKGLGSFSSISALFAYEDVESQFAVSQSYFPGEDTGGHGRPIDIPPPEGRTFQRTFEEFTGSTMSFTPIFAMDSRDDPFDPNRGKRLSLRTRFAGGPLGGDYDYIRPEINFSIFKTVHKKVVLAGNFEVGQFFTYNDSEIPIYERFRLGGERTLRGIPYYTVVPRTEDGAYFTTGAGSRLGGDRFWLVNLEVQFRVGGPVKLVLFSDNGNAYHEDQGWEPSLFRKTVGIELRVFMPIFQAPLRFIYGKNLDPWPEEDNSDFQFSIGTTF
jgi:outer membrane protein insertion porin family